MRKFCYNQKSMKSFLTFIWETAKVIIIALVIVIPIRYFVFQPFFVKGQSMDPSFENGDYLIVDEISYLFLSPKRGEVIVFKYPRNPSQRYIKRIIGLPGETIEVKNGKIVVSDKEGSRILDESGYLSLGLQTYGALQIALGKDEYFVLGDNRSASSDSRSWGALRKENIVGRVFVRAWPVTALAKIEAPNY